MTRFIMPIILIGIAASIFFVFTNPLYDSTDSASPGLTMLKDQVASYNSALDNAKALGSERDKLTAKYSAIAREDLTKLQKLLPDSVNNIRLILEIEQIASPYGMTLTDVKYNSSTTATDTSPVAGTAIQGRAAAKPISKDYGVFDLAFSTSGTYSNFINFTKGLENNLRIADISSVSFSSNAGNSGAKTDPTAEVYKYDFNIKTYWLTN